MTKTEKILLVITGVFFLVICFLLPGTDAAVKTQGVFELPGPVPENTPVPGEVWVTVSRRIDINHASAQELHNAVSGAAMDAQELTALPGVGAVTAEAIVAYRTEHGPFSAPEDLLLVPGVGEATLKAILAAGEQQGG